MAAAAEAQRASLEKQAEIEALQAERAALEAKLAEQTLALARCETTAQVLAKKLSPPSTPEETADRRQAFAADGEGNERSAAAAERALNRAVAKLKDALPQDDGLAAIVLGHLCAQRGRGRKVAALAGVTIGGQKRSQAEEALANFRSSLDKMRDDHRLLSGDAQNAIKTFLTLITAAEDEGEEEDAEERKRRVRGKQAAEARERGEEPPPAAVTHVREKAAMLGMSVGGAWRHLRAAAERRHKLTEEEDAAYWLCTERRAGHGLSDDTKKLVYDYYVGHPSIKRSPMKGDTLLLRGADGVRNVAVQKLLCEVSLTDVYDDFIKAHPDVKIGERAFRSLQPAEMRRMTARQLNMCGCRRAHRSIPYPTALTIVVVRSPDLGTASR